jgi:hypothetical protein
MEEEEMRGRRRMRAEGSIFLGDARREKKDRTWG